MSKPKAELYKIQDPHMMPPPPEREPREPKKGKKKKRKPYAAFKPTNSSIWS